MSTFVSVIHVITCILLVLVVMIQSGKGAEISATFGGSSQTVFGSSGGANFFTRFTSGAAIVFMITSIALTIMGQHSNKSLFEGAANPASAPAAPTSTTVPGAPKAGSAPNTTAPAAANSAPAAEQKPAAPAAPAQPR